METAHTNEKRFLVAKPYLPGADPAQTIARYFPPERVQQLIDQKAIYFHPVDKYRSDYEKGNGGDPNENKAPEAQYAGSWPRNNPRQREVHERIHALKKQQVEPYVSCWTKFNDENRRMWAEYGTKPGSLCLITTVGKLLSSLTSANVYAREICYIPVDSYESSAHEAKRNRVGGALFSFPALTLEDIELDCFLKTRNHAWEQEIRFAIFSQHELNKEQRLIQISDMKHVADRIILSPGYDNGAGQDRQILADLFNVKIQDSKYSLEIFDDENAAS